MPPSRGYSQVVEIPPGSRLLDISGQVPLDSAGQLIAPRDFRGQAEQVFAGTLVEVSRLFRDDVLLEVEAVAAVPRP